MKKDEEVIYEKKNTFNNFNISLAFIFGIIGGYIVYEKPIILFNILIKALPFTIILLFVLFIWSLIHSSKPVTESSEIPNTSALRGCTNPEILKNIRVVNKEQLKKILKNIGLWYGIYIILLVLTIIKLSVNG